MVVEPVEQERDIWKEAEEKERRREEKKRQKEEKKEKMEKREKEKWRLGDAKAKKGTEAEKPVAVKPKSKKEKDGSLGVDEWNEVRKSLGLKPLKS
mmetsp:Transcript_87331/g.245137  ORF Transcript_87331/g.245137 Transcript_87331/m.245137 type:complete len:96 (+) Transcript_87331:345-632(+)